MSCGLIEAIIFCRQTVNADHGRYAMTDLEITLSSLAPSSADELTDNSAQQSILDNERASMSASQCRRLCRCPRSPANIVTAQGIGAH